MIDETIDSIVGTVTGVIDYVLANMDVVAFVILAAIALVAAVMVVTAKEIMHSAFYLALVFICVATTYYFLEAEFLGVIQILVYVGAITILFAFSIMLTRRTIMQGGDE